MINVDLKHFPSKIKKAKSIALIGLSLIHI